MGDCRVRERVVFVKKGNFIIGKEVKSVAEVIVEKGVTCWSEFWEMGCEVWG